TPCAARDCRTRVCMAIPKKGSRIVTVDGVRYRWRIRRKPTYCQGAFASHLLVAAERVEAPSRCVLLLTARFPRPDNWLSRRSESVTPQQVAASIRDALAHGWHPDRAGSSFTHPLSAKPNP